VSKGLSKRWGSREPGEHRVVETMLSAQDFVKDQLSHCGYRLRGHWVGRRLVKLQGSEREATPELQLVRATCPPRIRRLGFCYFNPSGRRFSTSSSRIGRSLCQTNRIPATPTPMPALMAKNQR
jgi:hypothetical protein